ncbi:MAG: aminotransferase class III-fold pyridoxal phosphate-dependent enzyme [Synergistaceae bacterium]|nr:aminotransferase class III-fold pyridoxal phosphate-dependent enzyme [Synergistaceae bacterium]
MSGLYGSRGLEIVEGRGAVVRDSTGKSYVDFLCGNGSALFGHTHPVLVEAAQKALLSPWTISPSLISSSRDGLRKVLSELLPEGRVFLCNSGTEAIEAALKLALSFRPGRKKIVALRRAFHGRTLGALALTFNPQYRRAWGDFLLPVQHVALDDAPQAIDEETAAVFLEPVQGEGGVYPLDEAAGSAITKACRAAGALLVTDEIQSGWGRCGSVLAGSRIGLEPDIVALAKGLAGGLPVGATIWKGELGDFPPKGHGSTYGGNPVVASVALASWNLLHTERYPESALENGDFFASLIKDLKSPLIREIRHRGLLFGVELTVRADLVVKGLQGQGVLALNAGPQVVRFLPPFTAEREHFCTVAKTLGEVLAGLKNLRENAAD